MKLNLEDSIDISTVEMTVRQKERSQIWRKIRSKGLHNIFLELNELNRGTISLGIVLVNIGSVSLRCKLASKIYPSSTIP